MKKLILNPLAYSLLSIGFLSSFGGCDAEKLEISDAHSVSYNHGCTNNGTLMESNFHSETELDLRNSEYTFRDPVSLQSITFEYVRGALDRNSKIALSQAGSIDAFQVREKVLTGSGKAIYTLIADENATNDKNRVSIEDCANAFEQGDRLQIEILD